jgi:hypothetical protein
VAAQLYREAPYHQQPEHDHKRQVETGEARSVKEREGKKQRATRGDEPDLVPIPHRAYGLKNRAPLPVGSGHDQISGTRAEIKAVQQDVHGEHEPNANEPGRFQVNLLLP